MRYLVVLAAVLGLLFIVTGAVAGVAIMDAKRTRIQLREERAEMGKALQELETRLELLQEQADRVESTKTAAFDVWKLQSRFSQAESPPRPPRYLTGVGGPGPRRK